MLLTLSVLKEVRARTYLKMNFKKPKKYSEQITQTLNKILFQTQLFHGNKHAREHVEHTGQMLFISLRKLLEGSWILK